MSYLNIFWVLNPNASFKNSLILNINQYLFDHPIIESNLKILQIEFDFENYLIHLDFE